MRKNPSSEIPAPSALAPLLLRVFFAFVLVYGTQDNVFSTVRMHEFKDFLAANGFPLPLASAYLSVYAQFVSGLLLAVGWLSRWAAAVVVVNFSIALGMVHRGLPFDANIAPLAMLVMALFFVLYGAGRYSGRRLPGEEEPIVSRSRGGPGDGSRGRR